MNKTKKNLDALVEIEEYFDEYFTDTIQEVIENVEADS